MVTKIKMKDGRAACFENIKVENGELYADRIWFELIDPGDAEKYKQEETETYEVTMRVLKTRGIDTLNNVEVVLALVGIIEEYRKKIRGIFRVLYD